MRLLSTIVTALIAAYVWCGKLIIQDSQSLIAYSSNKGEKTYYQFQFSTENQIDSSASIEVIFPKDFDYVSFPDNPECYIKNGSQNDFVQKSCTISKSGVVLVQIDNIPVDIITLVVGQIINPKYIDMSSQFRLRTYYNNVIVDSNDIFGYVSFSEKPSQISDLQVYKLSNSRISEGSSWEFHFTPQNSYGSGNSFRFTFPDGFQSNRVICDVQGLSGSDPRTTVLFNKRMISCQNLNKEISGKQVVKIINMKNPNFSGIMQGFSMEIMLGASTVVLEKGVYGGSVIISPGEPTLSYVSSDQFKWSNSTYSFFVNLINPAYYGDKLFLNFTSEWNLFNPNCTIVNGFEYNEDDPVTCSLIPNQNSYVVEKFTKIDNSKRLILTVLLETPRVENLYPITISTYNTEKSAIIDLNSLTININSTYGMINRFVTHPLKQPTVAQAGKVGSLEMTFFLKTFLPKSDVDSYGKLRVDIFPQIPKPDSQYGTVECKFYGETDSANACGDTLSSFITTDSTRTTIYIYTPKDYSYQQSEVPITIMPAGNDENYYKGFPLDPLVQRYFFHVQIWSRSNTGANKPAPNALPDIINGPTNVDPDEVYFSEFIPKYREIDGPDDPDLIKTSLPNKPTYPKAPNVILDYRGQEADDYTYIEVKYIHQDKAVKDYIKRAASIRFYVLRVYFVSGWATGLGYTTATSDKYIKNYPCRLQGDILTNPIPSSPFSQCDLYIDSSDTPYLQVNGLRTENFDVNSYITVGIPRIKVANSPSSNAVVTVEIHEDQPGYWDPTVIVYKTKQLTIFQILAKSVLSVGSSLTFTPSIVRLNQDSVYTLQFNQVITTIDAVAVDWDSSLPITFAELDCTGTSGPITCLKFPSPVNWIYLTGAGIKQATVNFILPLGTSKNVPHEKTLTFKARSFYTNGSSQKVVSNSVLKQYTYNPMTMITTSFTSLIAAPNYQYQGYVSSHNIKFTMIEKMPDNWYVQIDLQDNMLILNDRFFIFKNNNVVLNALDQRGLLFEFNNSGKTFVIYNLKAASVGDQVDFDVTIKMPYQTTCTAKIDIKAEYNYPYAGFTKRVNVVANVAHQDGVIPLNAAAMVDFRVIDPINYKISPTESFIGPFNFKLKLSTSLNVLDTITFRWQRETTAPAPGFSFRHFADTTLIPIICSIGGANHPCTASEAETNYIKVILTLYSPLAAGTDFDIQITTDMAYGDQGLQYPKEGGYYEFKVDSFKTLTNSHQLYTTNIFIRPTEFTDLTFDFAHTTQLQSNIFEVTFIPSRSVNSYSNGGRVTFYFPIQQASKTLFASDLGLGSSDPGCWFSSTFSKEATDKLKCVLKKAGSGTITQQLEYSVKIEVINFAALNAGTTYQIIIGKVKNPAVNASPYDITLMTYNISPTNNKVTYRNSYLKSLFINESNDSQVNEVSVEMTAFSDKVQNLSKDVTHRIRYANKAFAAGDYFITDLSNTPFTTVEVTSTANQNQGNTKTCDTTKYTYCICMSDIKWVIWKIKTPIVANTAQDAYISLEKLPVQIKRSATTYESYAFITKKYAGKITETIPTASWDTLRETIVSPSMDLVSAAEYYIQSRSKAEILIKFTTKSDITQDGSILIIFHASYVPQAHCRSSIALGSLLYSQAGNNIGEIGCSVQSNGWYITGFQAISANKQVIIQGTVNLPTTSQTFSVYTFGTRDDTNIFTTGETIDFVTNVSSLAIQATSNFNIDTTIMLTQSEPIRKGYVGEFRFLLKSSSNIQNQNILIQFQIKQAIGSGILGFGSMNSLSSFIIGYAISNGSITPLQLVSYNENSNYNEFLFNTPTALLANIEYTIVVTTQQLDDSLTDGIKWPTAEGIYRVEISTSNVYHTEYIEIYGPNFSSLTFYSTNNRQGESNLIFVSLQPTNTIQQNDWVVIEFNTQSLDSINLFSSDLGQSLLSQTKIDADFVDTVITSGNCYIFNGNQSLQTAARIICTGFNTNIVGATNTLKLFFTIKNPTGFTEDTHIPIVVYSVQTSLTGDFTKMNWQLVEQQFILKKTLPAALPQVACSRQSDIYGAQFNYYDITTPVAMAVNDMLIVDMNIPNFPALSTSISTSCTSGVFYLLGNLKKMVCQFTAALSSGTAVRFTNSNSIKFQNPWSSLTVAQLQPNILSSILSDKTQNANSFSCTSMNILTTSPSLFTVTVASPILIHSTTYDMHTDFIYSFTSNNLSKITTIEVTHGIPGMVINTSKIECQQHYTGSVNFIQINECYYDGTKYILSVVPGALDSTLYTIIFATKNRAGKNPSSASTSFSPTIVFKTNSGEIIYTYTNTASLTLYTSADSNIGSSMTPIDEDAISISNLRYFDNYPFYINSVDSGPIVIEYYSTESQAIGTTIIFNLPAKVNPFITISTTSYISNSDIQNALLICKINGVQQTTCSYSSQVITVTLDQAIALNSKYTFYFTVIDHTNYPSKQGFYWKTSSASDETVGYIEIKTPSNLYQSDLINFATNLSTYQANGITVATFVTTHLIPNEKNLITASLTLSSSVVTMLIFEFDSATSQGTQIYTSNTMHGLKTGTKFPCSGGTSTTLPPTCWIEQGNYDSSSKYSKPIRVFVTDFSYLPATAFNINLLIQNPSSANMYLNFRVKALEGSNLDQNRVSGFFDYFYQLKMNSNTKSTVSNSVTVSNYFTTSPSYTFNFNTNSNYMIFIPLAYCTQGTQTSQLDMMGYNDSNGEAYIIYLSSGMSSTKTLTNINCQDMGSNKIIYYGSDAAISLVEYSASFSITEINASTCNSCFTSPSQSTFIPQNSASIAYGAIYIQSSTSFSLSSGLTLVVTFWTGQITVNACAIRNGLYSGSNDISYLTSCTVSGSSIEITGFTDIKSGQDIDIMLEYSLTSFISTPSVDITVKSGSSIFAQQTGVALNVSGVTSKSSNAVFSATPYSLYNTGAFDDEYILLFSITPSSSITLNSSDIFTIDIEFEDDLFNSYSPTQQSFNLITDLGGILSYNSLSVLGNKIVLHISISSSTTWAVTDTVDIQLKVGNLNLKKSSPYNYVSQFYNLLINFNYPATSVSYSLFQQALLTGNPSVQKLASSLSAYSMSISTSTVTEIKLELNSLYQPITDSIGDYILIELAGVVWPNNLIPNLSASNPNSQVDCLCYQTPTASLTSVKCYGHYTKTSYYRTLVSIRGLTLISTDNLTCYIPLITTSSSTTGWNVYVSKMNGPIFKVSSTSTLGLMRYNQVTSFETNIQLSSTANVITNNSNPVILNLNLNTPTSITINHGSTFSQFILKMQQQCNQNLLLLTTCNSNLDLCRIYSTVSNTFVYSGSSSTSVNIPLDFTNFKCISYDRLQDNYKFQLYGYNLGIQINSGSEDQSFNSIILPSSTLSSTKVKVFSIFPIRRNMVNTLKIQYALPIDFTSSSLITLTPSTSGDFTISSCSAHIGTSNKQIPFKCSVNLNKISIAINRAIVATTEIVIIISGQTNTDSTFNLITETYPIYISSTNYNKATSITINVPHSGKVQTNNMPSLINFKLIQFTPLKYVTTATVLAPIRFRFQHSADFNTGFNQVEAYFKHTSGSNPMFSTAGSVSGQSLLCYYKIIYSENYYDVLPSFICSATYDSSRKWTKIVAPLPEYNFQFSINTLYELVLTTQLTVTTPGLKFTAELLDLYLKIDATTDYYGETNYDYQDFTFITLNKLFYTSKSKNSLTSLYLEFTTASFAAFPSDYIEIILSDLGSTSFPTYTPNGKQISCDPQVAAYQSGFTSTSPCIVNKRNNDIVIKVLYLQSASALQLAIEDILLPNTSGVVVFSLTYRQLKLSGNRHYVYRYKYISQVFVLTPSVSITPTTDSMTIDLKEYGQSGVTLKLSSSFTNPLSTNAAQPKADKVKIKVSGGYFSMSANTFAVVNFYENASAYTSLWSNKYALTLYAQVAATGGTIQPSIKNLVNPTVNDKLAFETPTPSISYEFYKTFALNKQVTSSGITLVSSANYNKMTSTFTISTESQNQSTTPQSTAWLKITLNVNSLPAATITQTQKSSFTQMTLTELVGINTFYECFFIVSTGISQQIGCEVSGNKSLKITNLKNASFGSAWIIFVRAKVQSNQFQYSVDATAYTTKDPTSTSLSFWTFTSALQTMTATYNSGWSIFLQIGFPMNKYFSNYYERKLTSLIPGLTTVNQANFQFKPDQNLANSDTVTVTLGKYSTYKVIDPASSQLYCLTSVQISTFKYGFGRKTTCTHSSGVYTFTPPDNGMSTSMTYLINAKIDNTVAGSFSAISSTPHRQDVTYEFNSKKNVEVLQLKLTLKKLQTVQYSFTKNQFDYFELKINLKTALPIGSASSESTIYLELPDGVYPADAGLKTIYALDSKTFYNGQLHDYIGYSNSKGIAQLGYTGQPFRIAIVGFNALSAGIDQDISIPFIRNINSNVQIYFNIKTVTVTSDPKAPTIINEQLVIKNSITTTSTPSICSYTALTATTYVQQTSNASVRIQVSNTGTVASGQIFMFKPQTTLTGYDFNSWGSVIASGATIKQYSETSAIVVKFSSSKTNFDLTGTVFTSSDERQKFGFSYFTTADTLVTKSFCDLTSTLTPEFTHYTSIVSGSVSITTPVNNQNSHTVVQLRFNVRKLPKDSTITITLNSPNIFSNHFVHTISYSSGAVLPTGQFSSISLTPNLNNQKLEITGFNTIASGSTILITVSVQTISASGSITFDYDAKGPKGNLIEQFTLGTTSITSSALTLPISNFSTDFQVMKYIGSGQWGPIEIKYKLYNVDITFVDSTSMLQLTVPSDFTRATGGVQNIRYQQENALYWVDAIASNFGSTPINIQPPHTNYDMIHNIEYNMLAETKLSASNNNGFQYPSIYGYYKFILTALKGGSGKEYAYDYFILKPQPDQNLQVQALNRQAGHKTVLKFTWQLTVAAAAGDEIWIEFPTNNGNYVDAGTYINNDKVFLDDLGTGSNFSILDCAEADNLTIISASKLFCDIIQMGDKTMVPPNDIKAVVRIKITNSIGSGTTIGFLVAGIRNPLFNDRRALLTVSLRKTPVQTGFTNSQKVAYQISMDEYYTTSSTTYFDETNPTPTIVYLPSQPTDAPLFRQTTFAATGVVFDINQQHSWNILSNTDFANNDWVMVEYTLNNNSVLPDLCLPATECYVFKSIGWIIKKVTGVAGSSKYKSFTITGMSNGLYRYGGQFKVDHWDSNGNLNIAYQVTGLTYAFDTTGISFTVHPTLTPQEAYIIDNYWLTDFDNVGKIVVTGIWKHQNIRSFWLLKPPQINKFNTNYKYCNATLNVDTSVRKPYPWRFNCQVFNTGSIFLELTSDFTDTSTYASKDIIIYVNMNILEFTSPGPTSNFQFYSSVASSATNDQNLGVTSGTFKINISPYIQPDLRDITFNAASFKDRKAQPSDQVEFYMLIQPQTALSLHQIDKMIFRIPNEFDYAPIKSLDNCSMKGKILTPVTSCDLQRSYGYTYVTLIPDITYDNTVKIVRLSDNTNSNLFKTPTLPGNFYNITCDLYSNGQLLERQTINITRVLGYSYKVNSVKATFFLDELSSGLIYFESQLGTQDIQPGYDTPAAMMYTSLEFSFSNNDDQFLQDLGTGLKSGDEIPCLGGPEIKLIVKKRLTCIITLGTGPQNLPTINVFGYDKISAGTVVRIYFPQIRTIKSGLTQEANTYTSVRIYYKWINYSAIFYEPKPLTVLDPTPVNALTVSTIDATTSGSNKVGQAKSYTFSITLSTTLKITDYLIFNFPTDYFYRYSDYSLVSATGYNVQVYGISNQIYLQPTAPQSGTISVTIQNLINPAYSQNVAVQVEVLEMVDQKIVTKILFNVNKLLNTPIIPCSDFTKAEVIVDTNIGEQNGAAFRINFITGHEIPSSTGAISISLPDSYPYNFYEMQTACKLVNFDKQAQCSIGSSTRMDIFLYGAVIQSNKQYSVILQNVNTFIGSNLKMQITSFYSNNIYLNQQICVKDFNYPNFISSPVSDCTIIADSSVLNANSQSLYTFQFQCVQVVRENTIIEVLMPIQYKITNSLGDSLNCFSSEPSTLRTSDCKFVQSNLSYVIRLNVQSIKSQSLFSVSVYLNNPKIILASGYTFTATFSSYQVVYATTSEKSNPIILTSAIPTVKDSPQIQLSNIPKNAGQYSTYTFTIPPLGNQYQNKYISTVEIQFPNNGDFGMSLGENIDCGIYLTEEYDDSFLTYVGLLQIAYGRDQTSRAYTKLECYNSAKFTLKIDTTQVIYPIGGAADNLQNISTLWQHFIIRNIVNPKQYTSSNTFTISYINQNSIYWKITKNLYYQITKAPSYIKVGSVYADSNNIRTTTPYHLTFSTSDRLPENPIVGISVTLPNQLYKTVSSLYTDKINNCNLINSSSSIKTSQVLSCDIYNLEVLAERANFVQLNSASQFTLDINSLINPNIEHTCTTSDINKFNIKIIDWNSGNILFATSPSIDDKNCLSFNKSSFDINVIGPLTVYPGLSYQYLVTLEKPADNLQIKPVSPISGIQFDPEIITLSNYTQTQVVLNIKLRSDVLPKIYTIQFETMTPYQESYEVLSLPSSFYLPILPLTIRVVPFSQSSSSDKPTLKVENVSVNSIGYPIRIPVTLSAAPANSLFLSIKVQEPIYSKIILIDQPLLQINPNIKDTYFTIRILSEIVPELPATLVFSLTSYYTIVHTLTYDKKYISFSLNRSYSQGLQPLVVAIDNTKIDTPKDDIGKAVVYVPYTDIDKTTKLYYDTFSPKIIQHSLKSTAANSATFTVYASSECILYVTYSLYGNPRPITIESILNKQYQYGISYSSYNIVRSINSNSVIDYKIEFNLENLQAQTNYQVHIFLQNTFGYSTLSYLSFKTARISFGSVISLPFSSIIPINDVIGALSKVLQIPVSRIISKTDINKLKQRASEFDSNIMVKQDYYYDLVIAPNQLDDSIPTSTYVDQLKNNDDTRKRLSSLLSQFDLFQTINSLQIIQGIPKVDITPYPVEIQYNNATFSMRLWEQGYIFAIVRNILDIDENNPPVSTQIFSGTDETNKQLSNYKVYKGITDENGQITITVDDLIDGNTYNLYVTVGNNLPYTPLNLFEDQDILKYQFSTPFNLNLGEYDEKLETVKKSNPDLADALYDFLY